MSEKQGSKRYDAVLKELIPSAPRLIELLSGARLIKLLPTEFAEVQVRVPDLLALLDNGRILHLELQSDNDAMMPWRMLQYYLLIRLRHALPVEQRVLYVGKRKMAMTADLTEGQLTFRCAVLDLRDFEADELIDHGSQADHLLALLCGGGADRAKVARILATLRGLDHRAQQKAIAQLLLLSDLRGAREIVRGEAQDMPVTFPVEPGSFLYDMLELGRQEGGLIWARRSLIRSLSKRFGPPGSDVLDRVAAGDAESLDRWTLNVLDANSIEDVFREQE